MLGVFAIPMAFGALIAWVWIPELQTGPDPNAKPKAMRLPKLPNKSLERLAKGRAYATSTDTSIDPETGWPRGENQKLGFFEAVPEAWSRIVHRGKRKDLAKVMPLAVVGSEVELREARALHDANDENAAVMTNGFGTVAED